MAKKIKFPLVMKDDAEVRTMEELKEHFDIEKAVGYFLDGKLLSWLEARYYESEADAVRALDKNDAELRKKLCGIFGAEYDEEETAALDVEEAEERSRKLSKLRQYTSDQVILDKVDSVAFDQEDLADLLDNDVHDIYLCNNSFVIPLRVEDKKYIGIGKAEAVIKSEEWVDFAAKKIVFEGVEFDAIYAKKGIAAKTDTLLEKGLEAEKANDNATAFSYYMQAAEAGNAEGMYHVAYAYVWGIGTAKDAEKAQVWLEKALDYGNTSAMILQGDCYFYGEGGFGKNFDLGVEWYTKATDKGDSNAMLWLGRRYRLDDTPPDVRSIHTAIMWLEKAANSGNIEAMNDLGLIYEVGSVNGLGDNDYGQAYQWYKKAADLGSAEAMRRVGSCYWLGQGVDCDYDKALEWYHKAVDAGENAYAMIGQVWKSKSNLLEAKKWTQKAIEYEEKEGRDTKLYKEWLCEIERKPVYDKGIEAENRQDYTTAMECYRELANMGSSDGMFKVGWFYANGKGVNQNYSEAMNWYKKAADLGKTGAMNCIGEMYVNGNGVPINYDEALSWFKKADEAGDSTGTAWIGWMYENGHAHVTTWDCSNPFTWALDPNKDREEAYRWYRKAADAGNEFAKKKF